MLACDCDCECEVSLCEVCEVQRSVSTLTAGGESGAEHAGARAVARPDQAARAGAAGEAVDANGAAVRAGGGGQEAAAVARGAARAAQGADPAGGAPVRWDHELFRVLLVYCIYCI